MIDINNLKDLDQKFIEVEAAFARSQDEAYRVMGEFRYVIEEPLPPDPTSDQYRDMQVDIYYRLSQRDRYDPLRDEQTTFDWETLKDEPFPYCTKSPTMVGNQLIGQGFLIRALELPVGSRIVEFGPGWGNTTLQLAQMGYQMTAVDIEKKFLDMIDYRAKLVKKEIKLVQQDMLQFEADEPYDAALFYESFHHCFDHRLLIERLHKIVKDDGVIIFAGEPIVDHFPIPWGINLDGIAVWSIRKYGWHELGFNTSYFFRLLLYKGWSPARVTSPVAHLANVIIAKKSAPIYYPGQMTLPPDEEATWAIRETDPNFNLRYALKNSVMSVSRLVKPKAVEFCLTNYAPRPVSVTLGTGSHTQTVSIPTKTANTPFTIPVTDWQGHVTISSEEWSPKEYSRVKRIPTRLVPKRVLSQIDMRTLGIAVNSVRLVMD